MTFSPSHPRPAGRRPVATLWLVLLTASLGAQTPAPKPNAPAKPVAERWLLIVDTSAAMQKRAANVERVVSNLFAGGVGEQLHRGDTIGVWTYTDDLHAGQFPLQRWTPETRAAIAKGIVDFLKHRKYEKRSRLAPVMAQLTNVVADSDKITVLLISDGKDALTGTAYDAPMAEAYRLNGADQRKKQMPFLTVLRAVKGRFIGFTVNTPPWPVEFPRFPADPKPLAPGPAGSAAKPEPPPKPKLEAKPESKVEIKPERQPALPPVLPAPHPAPVTNVPPAANVPAPERTSPEPPLMAANPPASTPPVAVTQPPPGPPAPVVASKTNPVVQPDAVGPRAGSHTFRRIAVVAGSLLFLGLVLSFFRWRLRSRPRPRISLITRSIDRDPK